MCAASLLQSTRILFREKYLSKNIAFFSGLAIICDATKHSPDKTFNYFGMTVARSKSVHRFFITIRRVVSSENSATFYFSLKSTLFSFDPQKHLDPHIKSPYGLRKASPQLLLRLLKHFDQVGRPPSPLFPTRPNPPYLHNNQL